MMGGGIKRASHMSLKECQSLYLLSLGVKQSYGVPAATQADADDVRPGYQGSASATDRSAYHATDVSL